MPPPANACWGPRPRDSRRDPSASLRAGSFGFAQGRLLRLRSGQAPSASLRAGSFGFAQGRLLRLRSGRLPALRSFFALRVFFAGVKALPDTIATQGSVQPDVKGLSLTAAVL